MRGTWGSGKGSGSRCAGVLALVGALALLALPAAAQPQAAQPGQRQAVQRRAAPTPQETLKALTKRLELDEAQQQKILPILESQRTQLQGLRDELDSGKLERAEGRTRVDAIRKENDAKIEAVLRPEQVTEYQKMLARREQLRKQAQQRGVAPAAKPPAPQPEAQP